MSFAVAPDAYDRFMGRYSVPLAPQLADFASVDSAGQRVLDVGCGPGALTTELVKRLGPAAVSAVDPSEPFVAAARERHPGVSVQRAAAEDLPFEDEEFDAALAQLVVHFMADPVAGLREMARVTREGGVVAACVWDHAGGKGPLSVFWEAARQVDRGGRGRVGACRSPRGPPRRVASGRPGCARSRTSVLSVSVSTRASRSGGSCSSSALGRRAPSWPASTSSGEPSSASVCRGLLPEAPFVMTGLAWSARGLV